MRRLHMTKEAAGALLLTTLVFSCPGQLAANDLKERVLTAYTPFHTRLVETYSRLRISAEKKVRIGGTELQSIELLEYRSNGPLMRVDRAPIGSDQPTAESWVVNPADESFAVRRDSTGPWVLVKMAANPENSLETIRLDCPVAAGPFSFYEWDVRDFLADPRVSIVAFDELTDGDRVTAKVEFTFRSSETVTWEGFFLFDALRGWVIDGWNYNSARCAIRYKGAVDGIPLIESLATWVSPNESEAAPRELFRVRDIKVAPAAEDEFTLAAFGLHVAKRHENTHTVGLVLLAGIIMVLIGSLLRRTLQRSSR